MSSWITTCVWRIADLCRKSVIRHTQATHLAFWDCYLHRSKRRVIGANKTYQQKGDRGRLLSESDSSAYAVPSKAHGDREKAIAFVCRLYNVRTLDALPGAVRGAMVALLNQ